jgi:hypothetical protein
VLRRALALAGLALLVTAPAAGARIVEGKGIAGVRLEMSQSNVRHLLGTPDQIKHLTGGLGPSTQYVYSARRLRVTFFSGNRVTSVATTKRSERTTTGVGVGSTKAQLLAGVPHVHCPSSGPCQVGQSLPGRRVTAFYLDQARTKVTSVLIGFVID